MPVKINGTMCGGTPAWKASRSMLCSILLCSSRRLSWRVRSSSCRRRSSSALVCSHCRMESSALCHCIGGGGRGPIAVTAGKADSGGRVMADGGGRPRRELSIVGSGEGVLAAEPAATGFDEDRAAGIDCRMIEYS
jgi:hypothetical protein